MTFEEFIAKKKIDLVQFRTAEPGLFAEFQSHYSQMGEKSFDHSKKFLFNKLRRAYHLKEEPKPVPAKEIIEVNKIASQAEPLLSPTVEATVYTPRFRAGGTPKPAATTETPEETKTEKPAYIPRFKTAPAKSPDASPNNPSPEQQAKPAYVPRFKAATKIKEEPQPGQPASDPGSETSDLSSGKPKPAYVPRFKAPVKPKPAEGQSNEDSTEK